jgi:hypothetical protein
MPKLLAVMTFAAVYAASAPVVNRISVYRLGFWDPKFHTQAGNVAVADQALPIFVALASLSFLVGFSVQAGARRITPALAVASGALCGFAASVMLLSEPGLHQLGADEGFAAVVGLLAFWAGPAVAAMLSLRLMRSKPPLEESR